MWAGDADEAVDVARAAGRPVLVFVNHPYCPLCRQYEAGPFRDGAVARAADGFVLLKVGLENVPPWVARDLPRGWPILAVFEPGGKRLAGLTGYQAARRLAPWLEHVAGELRDRFESPSWAELRAAARQLARAAETDDAAETLAKAAAEFEGTPFGADLGRVLEHVRKYGSFPSLRENAGG